MRTGLLLFLILINLATYSQKLKTNECVFYNEDNQNKITKAWSGYIKSKNHRTTNEDTLTLPVVFHVIHQYGSKNLSDADIEQAFSLLNDGFANQNLFDQGSGIDTKIRFCMAKVDPEGNYTTGINHVYADLPKVIYPIHDQFLKSLINWDPSRYINIWILKDLQLIVEINECDEEDIKAGAYATLPSMHGTSKDGIVLKAGIVKGAAIVHEMGHYLGLLHTFEGCSNNDCTVDGDGVCDTPPQKKRGANCDGSSNSCQSDSQSGFTSDQNDLPFNFMDYGGCPHNFTPGQKERMRYMILNVRNSLLGQNVCNNSCPQPAKADFSFPVIDYKTGDSIHFNNTSAGNSYEWKIDDQLVSTSSDLDYIFSHQGWFKIDLLAKSLNDSCSHRQLNWIKVYCAVKPRITINKIKVRMYEDVSFSSTATIIRNGQDSVFYRWYYNDTLFSTAIDPVYQFQAPGDKVIYLVTQKGGCIDTSNYELLMVKPLPDFKLKLNYLKCEGEANKKLVFEICNDGFFDLPPGLPVSFYYANPTLQNTQRVTDVFLTASTIGKFCCGTFEVNFPADFTSPTGFIYAVINDDGSLPTPYNLNQFPLTQFFESNCTNNLDSLAVSEFKLVIFPKDTMVLLGSTLSFISSANSSYSIEWKATKGEVDCDTCKTTDFIVDGYARVVATAMSEGNCVAADTAIVKVYIDQDVLVPSAYTPNNDGKNDMFYILGSKHVAKINTLKIYNRWGEKVFERNDFRPNVPELGWDGKHKGKGAAMAVYVYYFTVDFTDGRTKSYKGTVTLIR